MHIDWATLVAVAIVAAGAALAVVMLVAFALVALSRHSEVEGPSGGSPGARPTVGRVVAGLCLLAAGLIVGYGLYLIVG